MLWIYVAAMLGVFRFRSRRYWKWVGILTAWLLGMQTLFSAHGTLRDPTGDGWITHQVRIATNDGPMLGVIGIIFVAAYWAGIIFIVRKLYRAGKEGEEKRFEEEWESGNRVPWYRMAGEAALLTAIAGAWLYAIVGLAMPTGAQPVPQHSNQQEVQTRNIDPVAAQLKKVAAENNVGLPQMLDQVTKLERTTAEGRVMTYHYRITRRDGSDQALASFVKKKILPKACGNKSMLDDMRDYQVIYRYSYMMPNATAPLEFDADWEECKALGFG